MLSAGKYPGKLLICSVGFDQLASWCQLNPRFSPCANYSTSKQHLNRLSMGSFFHPPFFWIRWILVAIDHHLNPWSGWAAMAPGVWIGEWFLDVWSQNRKGSVNDGDTMDAQVSRSHASRIRKAVSEHWYKEYVQRRRTMLLFGDKQKRVV